jgi:hypothetical protein
MTKDITAQRTLRSPAVRQGLPFSALSTDITAQVKVPEVYKPIPK